MRSGYYQDETGKNIDGYWHDSAMTAGEFYQNRKGQWFVIESVSKMRGPDGNNYFCQMRPMTQDEIDAMPKPNAKAEFNDLFNLFAGFDK